MTQAQLDFHNMTSQVTQEQIDLQNQLEMHTADLITKPLSNYSSVLFLDTKKTSDDPIPDQMEHQNIPSKNKTPSDHDQSPDTPPPTKKKYEIMKDPAFLSSPIYPPIIPTKPQLSTTRDDYLVPILSTNRFSFKSQLTSLCILLTTPSNCMIKISIFSRPLLLKLWHPINIGLKMESKYFLSNSISFAHRSMI